MLVKIATLMKRGEVYYLRAEIPADLKAKAKGTTIRLPIGDEFAEAKAGVPVSLRTKDKAKGIDVLPNVPSAVVRVSAFRSCARAGVVR